MFNHQTKRTHIPGDSRYMPFVQQPYCCVPACLQVILYKNDLPLYSQEELGGILGLQVPPKAKNVFWKAEVVQTPPVHGYGTRIQEKEHSLTKLISKLKLPLDIRFIMADNLANAQQLQEHLTLAETTDDDVIICFQADGVYRNGHMNGHAVVFDRFVSNEVRLIDPEPKNPKWLNVSIDDLYNAIQAHGVNNMAGLWIFNKS